MNLDSLQEKLDALSIREKIIILVAVLMVVWGAWDIFFYRGFSEQQSTYRQQMNDVNSQIAAEKMVAEKLIAAAKTDPNQNNRDALANLKNEHKELKKKLQLLSEKFISPKLMAKVLTDILEQGDNMPLLRLETLPVAPLLDFKWQMDIIYRHRMAISFSANYADTLEYLERLEALRWHFVIDSIEYRVKEYPLAEVTLHAHTLSFEESWLDV